MSGILSVLLIAEWWVHYFALFKYGIGYPLGLNGLCVAMLVAAGGGLVASNRSRWWILCSVAAVGSFVFVMAHIH